MKRPFIYATAAFALSVLLALGGALLFESSVEAGRPDHNVTAGGFTDFPAGNRYTLTLSARSKNGIATGQLQMQSRSLADTLHGVITCLAVDGNTAWVSGTFTHSPDEPGRVGDHFLVGVRDGGVGPGADPDERSPMDLREFVTADQCLNPTVGNFGPWTGGSVHVR